MTRFAALKRPENKGLLYQLIAGVAALLVIGGLSLSLIQSHAAQTNSNNSAQDAKDSAQDSQDSAEQSALAAKQANQALAVANQAIACLNEVLAERSSTTLADNKANIALATATRDDAASFQILLTDILQSAPDSKSTPDFLAYIKVHQTLIKVSTETSKTLAHDQAVRDAHPLGQC